MITIHLGQEGRFLSGRSRAGEVVNKAWDQTASSPVTIDFSGVESFTQSFISELLVQLSTKGVSLGAVRFTGLSNAELLDRANQELQRQAA